MFATTLHGGNITGILHSVGAADLGGALTPCHGRPLFIFIRKICFFFVLFIWALQPGLAASEDAVAPEVTDEAATALSTAEHRWIREHPVILAAPDPDFPPAEYFDDQGKYVGLVADYLVLLSRRLGLQIKIMRFENWSEVLVQAKQRRIDLVTAASETPQRKEFLRFSTPFIELPAVIIVRQQVTRNLTMETLSGMKVSVVREYAAHDYISHNYPELNLDLVPDIQTGLRKVSFGMVDAMVANIATVSYYIEKGTITNLRVAGESGFTYRLSFAPIKDLPQLQRILNKGLAQISPAERQRIYRKWIRLENDSVIDLRKVWGFLVALVGVIGLFISGILIWNRSLRRRVGEKTYELKQEVLEHEQAKKAMAESESRYRGIFEYTKSGVLVYQAVEDGKDFICIDFNKSAQIIDRLSRSNLLGRSIQEVFPNIRAFGLWDMIQRVWRTGRAEYYPAAWYSDHRIRGWRDYFVYRLPSQEIVTVYSDETVRKQAESALRESEEKLAGIVHSMTDHMVMLDEDLNIIWANKLAQRSFGEDITTRKCYTVFANRDTPCEDCIALRCFGNGRKHEHEIKVDRAGGTRMDFWETAGVAVLNESGLPKSVVTIFRDITERKALAAETMRAAHLASLGELAAGVAHEINNPINSIINLAQILNNDAGPDSDQRDISARVIKEGNRIAAIVRSLLAFARDRRETKRSVAVSEILDEALALTEAQVRKDGIVLSIDVSEDLPPVFGQIQQIQQVFLNIINNARYALNTRYPAAHENKRLLIRIRSVSISGDVFVRTVIKDHGVGIADDVIERIIDPFFTTKPSGVGTGLGLSISHGIISDHGGRLKIDSQPGEYTRVQIDLPVGG